LPVREGKGTAWEGGQREPLLIKYPKMIPKNTVTETPVMAIDILPSLAEATQAKLPEKIIDGKSVWPIFTGKTTKSPQEAYFFYYRVNELFGVRYGKWKLYFPHRYRTMNGQELGKDGLPGNYKMVDMNEIELYNLEEDERETKNVVSEYPEIVSKIEALASKMRYRLGDSLLDMEGVETRMPGQIE